MSESFPCLYTKHLTKKRKTWLDGRISVNFKSGSCSLFHAPDDRSTSTACLDQLETPLTADQLRRIRGGEELEIVFDSHLVTLEVPVAEPMLPPLKVPKFVPPRIVPPAPKPPPAASTSSVVAHRVQQPPSNGTRGHYSVDTGEVDSYWGGDDDDEAEKGSSERISTSALPAIAAHASRAEGQWEVNQEHVQPASSDSGHRVQRYEDEGDIWAEPSVPTPQKAQHQQQPPSRSVHAEAEDKTVAEWRGDGGVGVESDSPIQPNHTSREGGAAPAPAVAVAVAAAAEEEDIWVF